MQFPSRHIQCPAGETKWICTPNRSRSIHWTSKLLRNISWLYPNVGEQLIWRLGFSIPTIKGRKNLLCQNGLSRCFSPEISPKTNFWELQVTHGMSSSNVSTGEAKDCHSVERYDDVWNHMKSKNAPWESESMRGSYGSWLPLNFLLVLLWKKVPHRHSAQSVQRP